MPRYVDPAVQAYRESGRPLVQRALVWVRARAIDTQEPVAGGFWSGRDDATLDVIDPQTGLTVSRSYHAAGSLIGVETIDQASGVDIYPSQVVLSPVNDLVINQLQAYDLRGAAVEIHRLWLDYDTRAPIAPGHVWMTGTLNKAPLPTPAAQGTARLTYTVVPMTRALTLGNPEPVSDVVQQRRAGDRLMRYIGIAGIREIPWMRARVKTGSTSTGINAGTFRNPNDPGAGQ